MYMYMCSNVERQEQSNIHVGMYPVGEFFSENL